MDSSKGSPPPTMQQKGPPYLPTTWMLGGAPSKKVDIPVTAVFLVLYIIGAVMHMTILQTNNKKGHKFLFSGLLFGFNMARITTCVMRIASLALPTNISLGIAASIFVQAGVLLIFIVNIVFAQRVLRSQHPNLGWHKTTSIFLKVIYVLIFAVLAIVIVSVVQTFETLNPTIRAMDRKMQLFGVSFLGFISSLPFFIIAINYAIPRHESIDKFGAGRHQSKVMILLIGTFLVSFGAWYRAGTTYRTPVPRSRPLPSYFHKAAFYIVNFGVETIVNYMYALFRVDQRFHVPNGAKGKGAYQEGYRKAAAEKEKQAEGANRESTDELDAPTAEPKNDLEAQNAS